VVGDGTCEVGLGVGHTLHLAIVVAHREVALDEVAKCGVEVKHARLAIVDELVLDQVPASFGTRRRRAPWRCPEAHQ
jgi:hypothetical protein